MSAVPLSMASIMVLLILMAVAAKVFPAIGMLSPLISLDRALSEWDVGFFFHRVPFWAPHLILTGLLFATLFFAAVENLKDPRVRNPAAANLFLYLALAALFIFSAGSLNFFVTEPTNVYQEAGQLAILCFIACALLAVMAGGAPLTTRDFEELQRTPPLPERLLRLTIGGGIQSAGIYTSLVSVTAALVIILTLDRFPAIESPIITGALIGMVILTFSLAACMFSAMLKKWSRIQSRHLPRAAGLALCLAMTLLPLRVSSRAHEAHGKYTSTDIVLFATPIFAAGSALQPDQVMEKYPYCENFCAPVPPAVVSSLLFLLLAGVFGLAGARLESRMKRYSRLELYHLRRPDLAP
jgi:hypothetical protein